MKFIRFLYLLIPLCVLTEHQAGAQDHSIQIKVRNTTDTVAYLGYHFADKRYVLDTEAYSSGDQCRIKVVASDGFHVAEAETVSFSVSNPPQVSFVWPVDGEEDENERKVHTHDHTVQRDVAPVVRRSGYVSKGPAPSGGLEERDP